MADTACSLVWQLRPGQVRVEISNRSMFGGERTIVHALLPEQPFLVDSFRMTLARLGLREKLLLHPSLAIDREDDGSPAALGSGAGGREVYLYAEASLSDPGRHRELEVEIAHVLRQLQHVVADHGSMLETLRAHTEGIESFDRQGRRHARELMDFLYWLAADNFVSSATAATRSRSAAASGSCSSRAGAASGCCANRPRRASSRSRAEIRSPS